ncbi:hypothetical protein ACJX0J_027400, partial [Zea mays]
ENVISIGSIIWTSTTDRQEQLHCLRNKDWKMLEFFLELRSHMTGTCKQVVFAHCRHVCLTLTPPTAIAACKTPVLEKQTITCLNNKEEKYRRGGVEKNNNN